MAGADRIQVLDSWRGVCALLVAVYHFPVVGLVQSSPLARHSWLFVDFFFVLSGFVIAKVYAGRLRDAASTGRFIIKRFGRIWPLHIAVLALLVVKAHLMGDVGTSAEKSLVSIITNVFLIQSWGLHATDTWNFPAWSISVEWALYLIFALIAGSRFFWFIAAVLSVTGLAVVVAFAPHGLQSSYDFGVFRGCAGFFAGVLLVRLKGPTFGGFAEIATMLGVGLFVWFGQFVIVAPLVFAGTVFVFSRSNGPVSKLLSTAPFTALGRWSYSIYLLHVTIISLLWFVASPLGLTPDGEGGLDGGGMGDLYAVGYLVLLVLVAAITYEFWERPWKTYFQRLGDGSKPAPAVPESATSSAR
jgi:peptidoglycan/LPS O-acetylase OafA/YrhL